MVICMLGHPLLLQEEILSQVASGTKLHCEVSVQHLWHSGYQVRGNPGHNYLTYLGQDCYPQSPVPFLETISLLVHSGSGLFPHDDSIRVPHLSLSSPYHDVVTHALGVY
jgi:hypothetical protein